MLCVLTSRSLRVLGGGCLCAMLLALTTVSDRSAARVPQRPGIVTGTMPRDPQRESPWAWEPGMAMDARGTIWAVGNHCPIIDQHGACEIDRRVLGAQPDYTPLWRSSDGGRSYRFVSDPVRAPASAGGLLDRPGGLDTDVVVAPRARPGRPPLLYVVSSYVLGSTLAISGDGGRSWRVAQSAGVPAQDRPWLASSGRCDLYLGYHPFTGAYNVAAPPRVERYDGCRLFDAAAAGQVVARPQVSTPVEPAANELTEGAQVFAKPVAVGNRVYVAYLACDTVPPVNLDCDGAGDHQSLHVAISDDRAGSFRDVLLPDAHLHGSLNDGVWPMSIGADGRGDLAVAVTDAHHVRLWTSRDAGRSWRLRRDRVDAALGWRLATVPTVAVRGRTVAVAWYGSAPARPRAPQRWRLVLARSADRGSRFAFTVLRPTLARTPTGTPLGDALYDDFGAVITRRGAVAMVYTQSCADHVPSDRACPGPPPDGQATTDVVRYAWVPPAPARRGAHVRAPRRRPGSPRFTG